MESQNNNNEIIKEIGRTIVGGYYDFQEVRKACMNRIREVIQHRNENIDYDTIRAKKDKDKKAFNKKYSDTELPKLLEKMKIDNKLSMGEWDYIYKSLEATNGSKGFEKKYVPLMKKYMTEEKLYQEFLKNIKGIGPVLGSNLIAKIGYCERYNSVSALWKHFGFAPVNGQAVKLQKGVKVDFNPKLRTLAWKIADSFIKARTQPYRRLYDSEKARQMELLDNKAPNAPKSLMHAENRARRKMIKIFLEHYWVEARKMKGLPISEPYAIAILNHSHYISPPIKKPSNE